MSLEKVIATRAALSWLLNYTRDVKSHITLIPFINHYFNRVVAKRISLFREQSGKTNEMDTIVIEYVYATFRYDA